MHINKALRSQDIHRGAKHIPWIFPMLFYQAGTSNSLTGFDIHAWEIFSKAIHRLAWVSQRGLLEQKCLGLILLRYINAWTFRCIQKGIFLHMSENHRIVLGWMDLWKSLVWPPSQRTSASLLVSSGPCPVSFWISPGMAARHFSQDSVPGLHNPAGRRPWN